MRWPLIAASLLGAAVAASALIVLVGRRLPVAHVVARRARIAGAPDQVWATVTDVAGYPAWRPSVSRVNVARTELPAGAIAWAELSRRRAVHYAGIVDASRCRFTTRITDRELPYGGSWQIDIAPCAPNGSTPSTLVTITERGEVYNPLLRAISRYVIGHSATIDGYLRDLGKRFASPVVSEPVTPAEPIAPGDPPLAPSAAGGRDGP